MSDERFELRKTWPGGLFISPGDSLTVPSSRGELCLFPQTAVIAVAVKRVGNEWWFVDSDGAEHAATEAPKPPPQPPKHHTFKAGKMLLLSSGDYSSYGITGLFQVVKDFDPYDEARSRSIVSDGLVAHLLKQGFLVELPYSELHMDDYGKAEDMYVSE